jgi:serine/threonine protein kinase
MAESSAAAPSPSPRPIPARVGRYDILLPIASGGMATVYLATSRGARGFVRHVALKLTHAHLREVSEFAAVVLEEARLASRVRHKNVVSVLDVGDDPLGLFLVMDYVEGDTLGWLVNQGLAKKTPLPPRIGVRILLDALAGLHATHELCDDGGQLLGVVHRDFTPQNILVGLDGVGQLTDFGIAKAADRTGYTEAGMVKGKVSYMAPEQARGAPIDRRADVWSAGVVAWELFAGQRLYPTGDGVSTLLRVVQETPPRLRVIMPGIPAGIDEAVGAALMRKPDRRIGTAADFARTLASACRSAGILAEQEEVAHYVTQSLGPKLAARRAQLQHVVGLRKAMEAIAAASVASSGEGGSGVRAPVSMSAEPGSSSDDVGRVLLDSDSGDDRFPSSGRLETELFRVRPKSDEMVTVVAPPRPGAIEIRRAEPVVEHPSPLTETTSAADLRPSRIRPIALFGVAAAAFVLVVLLFAAQKPTEESPAAVAVAATPATPTPPAAPSDTPEPPPTSTTAPTAPIVRVHSNAAMSSLRFGARTVSLEGPSTDVAFERRDTEVGKMVKLVGIAIDGRVATAILRPDATSLEIDFAPKPVSGGVPPPASRPKPPNLAPSPYGP